MGRSTGREGKPLLVPLRNVKLLGLEMASTGFAYLDSGETGLDWLSQDGIQADCRLTLTVLMSSAVSDPATDAQVIFGFCEACRAFAANL